LKVWILIEADPSGAIIGVYDSEEKCKQGIVDNDYNKEQIYFEDYDVQ
jgi:hypothetical protein